VTTIADGTDTAEIVIEVDGAPLLPLVAELLVSAEVDTSLFLPGQFSLVFQGERSDVLDAGFVIGVMVSIEVTEEDVPSPLMLGEITAIEIDYGPEGDLTIIRGLDLSHRLMRGTKTRAIPDTTISAAVELVLAEAGVEPGEIIPTEALYSQLTQGNINDWAFIQQLAAEVGYDAFCEDGLFCFRPQAAAAEGLEPSESYESPTMPTQLVLGENLIRLRGSVSGAEQVATVQVRGWNPLLAEPVIGEATAESLSASVDDFTVEPAALAEELGGIQYVATDRVYSNEGAAEAKANSLAWSLAGASAELQGECLGNPSIQAGSQVSLGMAGPPFDGQYIVSEAKHRYSPGSGGFTTWFSIGGRRDRSLLGLSGGGSGGTQTVRPSIPGVVVARVVDSDDPEGQGRVKLSFPWLDETYVTDYVRNVQAGAGLDYGCLFVPEVGAEVLVAFDRGDINYPYVIGGLYNGLSKPEPRPDIEGTVNERRIMSRMRHMLQFLDGEDRQGILLITGEEDCSIKIDAMEQAIQIVSAGMVSIEAAEEISITAGGDLSISTEGALSLEGSDVTITGTSVTITGEGDVGIEAAGEVSVAAAMIMLGEG